MYRAPIPSGAQAILSAPRTFCNTQFRQTTARRRDRGYRDTDQVFAEQRGVWHAAYERELKVRHYLDAAG